MKLSVERTNASLNFKFWLNSVEDYTTDKFPSQGYSLFRAFLVVVCLFTLLLLSCSANQISTAA